MKFRQITSYYEAKEVGVIYLVYSYWDDYKYCTTFTAYYKYDSKKEAVEIGTVKIGCKSLATKVTANTSSNGYPSYSVKELISTKSFTKLSNEFFSLGQDIQYYKNINEFLGNKNTIYYDALKDIGYNIDRFNRLYDRNEPCLMNSLMRNLYISDVEQFNRISRGGVELTKYSFAFRYNEEKIDINVVPTSLPPSNIHILIGRNGVGKTWLLYNIAHRLIENINLGNIELERSKKYSISDKFTIDCPRNSFAGIIGLSFSVFDDALPIDIANSTNIDPQLIEEFKKVYKYIGLISKNQRNGKSKIKSVEDMSVEFLEALNEINRNRNKIEIYLETCKNLNTDSMFYDNGFIELLEEYFEDRQKNTIKSIEENEDKIDSKISDKVKKYFKKLSSGHMIIMLSLTLLAESIREKTIILIDEPETHLHPPLLSTYIRTLSFLLLKKNAVAIIATHSPIVLQEVPKDCVNKVIRTGEDMSFERLILETFATNTDSLTREVFGLEVVKTGFYQLIQKEIDDTFDQTLKKFEGKVGFLGQVLMQSLVSEKRDESEED
ncbi:AAA family ATPase [Clostridium intestinale]|uniref:AAA domain-containing protein, putative AbiEii toxin, Type IV TA system n=1 Tax=Clostridium intestinale DSM 6191 TaxID=1121320 RepID=A0A1M6A510_9CLOT|nr:AAA family ATPase [Clostridium intestinale]SHI31479.1 AAA domain-containing protein, putative AbiEii toxin, Type IV TA system [Clostridium intestinale DSM 6191]